MTTNWERTRRILEAKGLADESGLTRKARMRRCRCGARVLSGLDGDWMALSMWMDPDPVDLVAAVQALAEGRRVRKLNVFAGVAYINWISWHLEDLTELTFLREHRCEGVTR